MQDKDELVSALKAANKEKDEVIEMLLKKSQEDEKRIRFLGEMLEDACRVIPERN